MLDRRELLVSIGDLGFRNRIGGSFSDLVDKDIGLFGVESPLNHRLMILRVEQIYFEELALSMRLDRMFLIDCACDLPLNTNLLVEVLD